MLEIIKLRRYRVIKSIMRKLLFSFRYDSEQFVENSFDIFLKSTFVFLKMSTA